MLTWRAAFVSSFDRSRTGRVLDARWLLALAVLGTLSLRCPAAAQDASAHGQAQQLGTRGHVQLGIALFDRGGTLARETDARGFAPFGGPTLRLGFVHYLKAVPWLGFGAGVRGTFGNSSKGGREYFYNPIFTSGTVAMQLPIGPRQSGFRLALDLGFTNILAKSRMPNGSRVDILHEYGIGPGFGLLAGYSLDVAALGTALTLSLQHSRHFVNVELDGGTTKSWALGVTTALAGFEW